MSIIFIDAAEDTDSNAGDQPKNSKSDNLPFLMSFHKEALATPDILDYWVKEYK